MVFNKENVDYSLYLVTDSSMLPDGTTLYSQVKAGLENGVTLVQLREKDIETKDFIREAVEVQKLCQSFNVPLIINDRIDVALAIGADGVHVGQDDMPIPMVRKLVGPDMIIGWSVGFRHEVETLAEWGPDMVDYIGVGTIFPTLTKKNPKKAPMGPQGAIEVLNALEDNKAHWCRTVAIGGLHPVNIERVLYQCVSSNGQRALDGISVVSDIMAAPDAAAATKNLRHLLDNPSYKFVNLGLKSETVSSETYREVVGQVTRNRPLVQHMTNKVHQNFGANVTLAVGSSPIMSEVKEEVHELARIPHAALLLNTGSVAPLDVLREAITAYNKEKRPIVFDPVGYSATEARRLLNDTLLSHGQFTCIKGNTSEILSLAKLTTEKMKGVDAFTGQLDKVMVAQATRVVAYTYKTVAVCTGEYDFVADGTFGGRYYLSCGLGISAKDIPCVAIHNGSIPIMGDITASGCSLGSTIACCVGGVAPESNLFDAVVTAVVLYKTAGKLASTRCQGNGSFNVQLLDALYQLFHENCPATWSTSLERLS
ncbi:hypothetical protein HG536_0E05500 [Torulaspora globosa]|uniref:Thiamine phosphate synthase/TenI domain-containing protein n=1 Tax=Torulaspora globosa TaxID=48254 RepID=A0A7G3ZJF3_9SACH|nr:uncharacterized protein HG536_0E05500 [Torulaspora globosa]QLL33639.1 hypothetical protein HG536_0E05500 [Torulaspora globosa]